MNIMDNDAIVVHVTSLLQLVYTWQYLGKTSDVLLTRIIWWVKTLSHRFGDLPMRILLVLLRIQPAEKRGLYFLPRAAMNIGMVLHRRYQVAPA